MPNNILSTIADNPALFAALRALLLAHFSIDGLRNDLGTRNNEALGELLRARLDAIATLDLALADILACKSIPSKSTTQNPGR